jgi:rhodanese-related sulfurtransferase
VKAAGAAKNAGYANVHIFSAGFPDWKSKGYEIEK